MTKFNKEEEKFLERQKRLNTIHRNMMAKCSGDDSNCTTGPPLSPTACYCFTAFEESHCAYHRGGECTRGRTSRGLSNPYPHDPDLGWY